jgi:hypothetical protein
VDVALILPEKDPDIAEVFIEVKAPNRLQNELGTGEDQLKRYNWSDKSAISILTDGTIWRFYLPSIGGAFENSLFSELNLLKDDIDSICTVFDQVLRRDRFRKQALESAEAIYEEIARIKKLSNVKHEAEDIAKKTGMPKYETASQLLKTQYNCDMESSEIERLWNRNIPRVTQAQTTPQQPVKQWNNDAMRVTQALTTPQQPVKQWNNNDKPASKDPDSLDFTTRNNYTHRSARVVIINGRQMNVTYWYELTKHVFNYMIEKHPAIASSGDWGLFSKSYDNMDVSLSNGMYADGKLSSTEVVRQCRALMKAAGYDPINDLKIGHIESSRKKKGI